MERGSDKHSPKLDDQMQQEAEPLERSGKESHVEGEREKEAPEGDIAGSGHRISGSGSSAEDYTLTDQGESGGASHPKPKQPEDRPDDGES
ncbi:hypothetical protein BH24ACT26_BH24ACT26_15360 [soil metagenome]